MSNRRQRKPSIKNSVPRLDAVNLSGITTLVNKQNIKSGINLDEAEKQIIGKSKDSDLQLGDPVKRYTDELNQLADELGIDLLDDVSDNNSPSGKKRTKKSISGPINSKIVDLIDDLNIDKIEDNNGSKYEDDEDDEDDDADDEDGSFEDDGEYDEEDEDGSEYDEEDEDGSEYDEDEEYDDRSCDDGNDDDDGSYDNILNGKDNKSRRHKIKDHKLMKRTGNVRFKTTPHKFLSGKITDEQEKRRHINSIVADIRGETRTTFGVANERIQDMKASKLEEIGQLKITLMDENIDCEGIPNPTIESPMEEIDSVLGILRLKNDRNRYSTLAEEVISGAAEMIESVFDGSREIPILGWRPDYTGYHNTVSVKLHRMRFETSQLVSGIIEKFNVGPMMRIMLELIPSLVLYPRQQGRQRGVSLPTQYPRVADSRRALIDIKDSDEVKNLLDVRNL